MRVAALYVDPQGVYSTFDGVECWGEELDARTYAGPWPVVAHPPCQRWGRYATLRHLGWDVEAGADGGCFAAALAAVRRWGGVLEHPAGSLAWAAHGLCPPCGMGWAQALDGSWSGLVWQGAYGHRAPKPTWLYYVGHAPPLALDTRPVDPGGRIERMCKAHREATPKSFALYLLALAHSST